MPVMQLFLYGQGMNAGFEDTDFVWNDGEIRRRLSEAAHENAQKTPTTFFVTVGYES
jgi:hypothetical protein